MEVRKGSLLRNIYAQSGQLDDLHPDCVRVKTNMLRRNMLQTLYHWEEY